MRKQKCLLDFRYYGDPALIAHVTGVRDGIFSNPTKFADVPVTEAEMNLLITTYTNAFAQYKTYKTVKKTEYLVARAKVIELLNLLASYVDEVANGDPAIISLAFFKPSKVSIEKSKALPAFNDFTAVRIMPGGLNVVIYPPKGLTSITYYSLVSQGAPIPPDAFVDNELTSSADLPFFKMNISRGRKRTMLNFEPGSTCYVYVGGINPVGVSPLSEPRVVVV